MTRSTASLMERLACLLHPLATRLIPIGSAASSIQESGAAPPETASAPAEPVATPEFLLRQERQAAIRELAGFLEQEIQRTLTKTRTELVEALNDSSLSELRTEGPLQRVEQASRDLIRIEAILNEVLDHAKPLELHPRITRITEVIENALTVVADELQQNKITVTREISDPLPAIKADESKLQQCLLSIFKNAMEAMTTGGHIHLAVNTHRIPRGRYEVAITIQNDGEPIPMEHIGKIFEPGFTTKAIGTGLGLSSVKKIIEEHRGQISIASGPGQGTTVIIRLPAYVPSRRPGRGRRGPGRR
jgi:signal transduction histidine kinase